jgi:hypothetical protein
VKAGVALCPHLRAERPELRVASDDVFAWSDGPITAVARCAACPGLALLELLDWSASGRVRVYAAAGLEPEPLAVYRRNRRSASCDAGRLERETAALLACAGPPERLLALDVRAAPRVLASAAAPERLALPDAPWPRRLLAPEDATWFAPVGLAKAAL